MRSRNKVEFIGHLGADPSVILLDNGIKKAEFTIATSESYTKKDTGEKVESTEWHKCVAFGKPAEIIEQYFKKGMKVLVEGKLKHRSYDDKDGVKKYITEVLINDFMFLTNKSEEGSGVTNQSQPQSEEDDDLPF